MNLLSSLIRDAAQENGNGAFLTDLRNGTTSSYLGLVERTNALAGFLAQRGIGAGDRVAYLTKNDPLFFPLLFACAQRGAALVPLNRDSAEEETANILKDSAPALVFCDEYARGRQEGWIVMEPSLHEGRNNDEVAAVEDDADALIIYTSGTTGRPKGVVLTHKNLSAMSRTFVEVYRFRTGRRCLCMLPYYHINAPVITGIACIMGGAHVFLTDPYGFTNARQVLPWVEEHHLNVLSITPSIMASMLKLQPDGGGADLSNLDFCLVGTAFLPEALWRAFEEAYGVPCYQGYGLTETTTWATLTPPDERKRYDSAGVPIGCEVKIDENDPGEVLIKGDIVMSRYFKRKSLTKKSVTNGWFRTGDIGVIDNDGQLRITGRIKNIIKRKGVLISPEEIDNCVRRHDAVTDCCTVGVTDELLGEKIYTACLVDPARLADVREQVTQHLSTWKYPDEFIVVGHLPKTPMGKPDLAALREIVSGNTAAAILNRINAYKYARHNAYPPDVVLEMIQHSLLAGTPLRLVGFWGVGSRDALADPDIVALDRLRSLLDAIDDTAGREDAAALTIVVADVHARCNQVPQEISEPYLRAIEGACRERRMATTRLGPIWAEHGLSFDTVLERMEDPAATQEFAAFALRDEFIKQAGNRVDDPSRIEEYALRYYLTCMTEIDTLAAHFDGQIFFTYNPPAARIALPPMPMIFLHSLSPGRAAKPWFLG